MKKILSLILFFIFLPALLTACSSQSEEISTTETNVKAVSESMLSDFEVCKSKEYVNLDLSNCGLHLTDFEECRSLNIKENNNTQSAAATAEENLQKFKEYCEFFFGEYDPEYAIFDSFDSFSDLGDIEVNGRTYVDYPKISDYYEEIKSESFTVNWLIYRDLYNNKYLWWRTSDANFPHWINKGEAIFLAGGKGMDTWIPSYINSEKKVASYINDGENDDVTYQLLDDEVSVGEAISYFENDYMKDFPYEFEDEDYYENWSLSVSSVDVCKLDDDLYCYVLYFSSAWRNIPFNHRGDCYIPNQTAYDYKDSGVALMLKKNDIDTVVNFDFPLIISEGEAVESICSLESAVDIISSKLSKNVVFEVESIEFVYAGLESEDYSTAYLEPCWKMLAYNPNDEYYYAIYVNAATEECRYLQYMPL